MSQPPAVSDIGVTDRIGVRVSIGIIGRKGGVVVRSVISPSPVRKRVG